MTGTLSHDGQSAPLTLKRGSSYPCSPSTGAPKIMTATCDGQAIDVTWDRPIVGWDFGIQDLGSADHFSGNDVADRSRFSYDPAGHVFHLALKANFGLVSGHHYRVDLDAGSAVNWHGAYGAAAWSDPASCSTITFTAP